MFIYSNTGLIHVYTLMRKHPAALTNKSTVYWYQQLSSELLDLKCFAEKYPDNYLDNLLLFAAKFL